MDPKAAGLLEFRVQPEVGWEWVRRRLEAGFESEGLLGVERGPVELMLSVVLWDRELFPTTDCGLRTKRARTAKSMIAKWP